MTTWDMLECRSAAYAANRSRVSWSTLSRSMDVLFTAGLPNVIIPSFVDPLFLWCQYSTAPMSSQEKVLKIARIDLLLITFDIKILHFIDLYLPVYISIDLYLLVNTNSIHGTVAEAGGSVEPPTFLFSPLPVRPGFTRPIPCEPVRCFLLDVGGKALPGRRWRGW